jgi:glutamate formiminotransferase / 5-formyltetrahydrofolate cyclo-ligase
MRPMPCGRGAEGWRRRHRARGSAGRRSAFHRTATAAGRHYDPLDAVLNHSNRSTPTDTGEVLLESVPNVSEGGDAGVIDAIGSAFGRGCDLLDVHSDPDYGRSVYTLVGRPQELADALLTGAKAAIERIDVRSHRGAHPCIGAVDVLPIVYLREEDRDLAKDEALAIANRLAGEHDVPVFLYGELASSPDRRERAYFREGGVEELDGRLGRREVEPDFGPPRLHPTAGGTLVAARPPLVAFNLELGTEDVQVARGIAARVRERDGGLSGLRAIGVRLESRDAVQLSMNVHDPFAMPLGTVVEAVRREAKKAGVEVVVGELVGLAPAAAMDGFPSDVPLRDFDARKHVLERRLEA